MPYDPHIHSLQDLGMPANRHIEPHYEDDELNGATEDSSHINTDQQREREGEHGSHGSMGLDDDQGNPENRASRRHTSRRA